MGTIAYLSVAVGGTLVLGGGVTGSPGDDDGSSSAASGKVADGNSDRQGGVNPAQHTSSGTIVRLAPTARPKLRCPQSRGAEARPSAGSTDRHSPGRVRPPPANPSLQPGHFAQGRTLGGRAASLAQASARRARSGDKLTDRRRVRA